MASDHGPDGFVFERGIPGEPGVYEASPGARGVSALPPKGRGVCSGEGGARGGGAREPNAARSFECELGGPEPGVEWAEGGLAPGLLAAALAEVAPRDVRARVFEAVDVVLREAGAAEAPAGAGSPGSEAVFAADAAPVTTLSGVFEKRPASAASARADTAEAASLDGEAAASCASTAVARLGTSAESPAPASAGFDDAPGVGSDAASAASAAPWSWAGASESASARAPGASWEGTPSLAGPHCHGGPMLGRRCRSTPSRRTRPSVEAAAEPERLLAASAAGEAHAAFGVGRARVDPASFGRATGGVARSVAAGRAAAVSPLGGVVAPRRGASSALASKLLSGPPPPAHASAAPAFDGADQPATIHPVTVRDDLRSSASSLAQLAAAIAVGIVIGKAAHLVLSDDPTFAWGSERASPAAGLQAEPSRSAAPGEPAASDASDGSDADVRAEGSAADGAVARRGRARQRGAARSGRAGSRAHPVSRSGVGASAAVATPRAIAAAVAPPSALCALSAAPGSEAAQGAALVAASLVAASAAPALVQGPAAPALLPASALGGCSPLPRGALPSFAPGALAAPHLVGAAPPPSSDDWLGEQLAILSLAERSLLAGDPDGVTRSLDEYRARFPNGLLDPQMASIRQRVEDRFTAFIFP